MAADKAGEFGQVTLPAALLEAAAIKPGTSSTAP